MMVHKIFLSYLKDLETYFNFRSILKNIKQKIVYTYLMRGNFFHLFHEDKKKIKIL